MIIVFDLSIVRNILAIRLVSKSILKLSIVLQIYEVIGQVVAQIESVLLRDVLHLMDRGHIGHKRIDRIYLALIEAGELAHILVAHIVESYVARRHLDLRLLLPIQLLSGKHFVFLRRWGLFHFFD